MQSNSKALLEAKSELEITLKEQRMLVANMQAEIEALRAENSNLVMKSASSHAPWEEDDDEAGALETVGAAFESFLARTSLCGGGGGGSIGGGRESLANGGTILSPPRRDKWS